VRVDERTCEASRTDLRPREFVIGRDAYVGQGDVGLVDGALAELVLDRLGGVPGGVAVVGALLDDERLDVTVGLVAGPDDHDVGKVPQADPAFGAVEEVAIAVAAGAGLQPQRVRPMVGFGEPERAERVERREAGQPALLLLLAAEMGDGADHQAGLHGVERVDAAVAARELVGDQSGLQARQPGAPVAGGRGADDAELGERSQEMLRELGALPVVVDARQHLRLDEGPHACGERAVLWRQIVLESEQISGCGG
jgi:hypothetical protein